MYWLRRQASQACSGNSTGCVLSHRLSPSAKCSDAQLPGPTPLVNQQDQSWFLWGCLLSSFSLALLLSMPLAQNSGLPSLFSKHESQSFHSELKATNLRVSLYFSQAKQGRTFLRGSGQHGWQSGRVLKRGE